MYKVYYSNKNNGYGNDLPAYVLSQKFPDEKQLNNSTNSGLAYRQGKIIYCSANLRACIQLANWQLFRTVTIYDIAIAL